MFRSSPYRPGLSGILCVEGDCLDGKRSVDQLLAFFAKVNDDPRAKPFAPAVQALFGSYQQTMSSWKRHIPFSPVCCEVKRIGDQAQSLLGEISQATGTRAVPKPPPSALESVAKTVGIVLALGFLGIVAMNVVTAVRNAPK